MPKPPKYHGLIEDRREPLNGGSHHFSCDCVTALWSLLVNASPCNFPYRSQKRIVSVMAMLHQSSLPTSVTLLWSILSMIPRPVRGMTRSVLLFLVVISFVTPSTARVYEYQLNCDLGKGNA